MATYTETIAQDGCIAPSSSFSSLVCDGRIADQIVDDFGVWVIVRVVTTTGYNNYGDKTSSNSDSWIKAYIHFWTSTDDEVKEGIFKNGEIMFVFKNDDSTKIKAGNEIFYSNEWYRIENVQPQIMANVTYLVNAIVRKKTGN